MLHFKAEKGKSYLINRADRDDREGKERKEEATAKSKRQGTRDLF